MLRYLRKNMKSIMIVVAILFAASVFYGLGVRTYKKEKTEGLAKINGKMIEPSRYYQVLNQLDSNFPGRKTPQQLTYLQIMALNQVIDYTLMLEDAKKKGISTGKKEVDSVLDQIMVMNKIPDIKTLEKNLKSRGIDLKTFKSLIRDDITIQKMIDKIKSGVTVNPEDLREIRARHILVSPKVEQKEGENFESAKARAEEEAKKKAEEILEKIKRGERFEVLAQKYSDDPGSKNQGGDLGFFKAGTMVPEFEKAAFSLKPGEVSGIVKTDYGYHIIKVEETRLRKAEEGKDIKTQILAEKQNQAIRNWLRGLREKAKIEIVSPLLKGHDLRMKGRQIEAIAEYQKVIVENPSNAYIYLLIGDSYMEIGETKLAISSYKKAEELNSADPDILITLGNAYEKAMGKFLDERDSYKNLALESFRRASLLAGDDKSLHEELKGYFKKLGSYKDVANEEKRITEITKKEEFEKKLMEEAGKK